MRLGDQRDLAKVKPPSELHQIGRREFVFKGGLTALALLLGGKFFSNRLGRATPLVEPETDGVTSSGEPQVEILQNISERQENDHDLAELAAKNPLMRQDILEYLGISDDPIIKYADTENAHVLSPTAIDNEFITTTIAQEKNPVRKMLLAIAYSGMQGNRQDKEPSPPIWANQYNPSNIDGGKFANKCNSYAQFISQVVTYGVGNGEVSDVKIGHVMEDATGLPVTITPNNISDVFSKTGVNKPYTEYGARNIALWLSSEVGGQKLEWQQLNHQPNIEEIAGYVLYVAKYSETDFNDGHNFIVFFDDKGNKFTTQSTYNTLLRPLSDDTWNKMFTDREYHVFAHKIVP